MYKWLVLPSGLETWSLDTWFAVDLCNVLLSVACLTLVQVPKVNEVCLVPVQCGFDGQFLNSELTPTYFCRFD